MKDMTKEEMQQLNEEQEPKTLTSEDLEQIAGGATEEEEGLTVEEKQKRLMSKARKRENRRKALRAFAKILQNDNH